MTSNETPYRLNGLEKEARLHLRLGPDDRCMPCTRAGLIPAVWTCETLGRLRAEIRALEAELHPEETR